LDENIYTVDEAAKIANLHPKTIIRFIKEGKIKGIKIGRQWRIKESDIKSFLYGDSQAHDFKIPTSKTFSGEINISPGGGIKEKIQVSTVIDVFVRDFDEATMLSNTFLAVLNCKDPEYGNSTYKFLFYEAEKKARFILWGTPVFVGKLLLLMTEIAQR